MNGTDSPVRGLRMRAPTALAGSLMLVLAMAPAPTIGQDDDGWPTPAELRQELADDGWEWAASTFLWMGGRGGPAVFLNHMPPLFLSVTVDDLWGSGLLSWTEQTQMSWTLFMEAVERLPIDDATLEAVAQEVMEQGCWDHPLEGGMLTVDGREAEYVSRISVEQDGEARCDLPPITEVPAESPAALSGKYQTDPGSGYGFEFEGETGYSHTGDDIASGTYTVDGSAVRICISFLCTDLQLVGDCLIQQDGGTYCKD